MLEGKRIRLRPLELDDLESLYRWRNDPWVMNALLNPFPAVRSQQEAWYRSKTCNPLTKIFIIEKKVKGTYKAVGSLGVDHLDWVPSQAEMGGL